MQVNVNNVDVMLKQTSELHEVDLTLLFRFTDGLLHEANNVLNDYSISTKFNFAKSGSSHLLEHRGKHYLLTSFGKEAKFSIFAFLAAINACATYIRNNNICSINVLVEDSLASKLGISNESLIESTVFYLLNSLYVFDELKSVKSELHLRELFVVTKHDVTSVLQSVANLLSGVNLIKHIANNPANKATPSYLAETMLSYSSLSDKVKVSVFGLDWIKEQKMGAFMAVAQGSVEEPRFIQLEYNGGSGDPIVLVGKGITFDAGGISIKPSKGMGDMRYDMCGAATVLGVFVSVAKMNLPINLVVLVPTCENMPSGSAVKPGDVITSFSGKTVEVLNTDAEGRLILCDALAYAKRYNPKLVIDAATLTGGCVVALGKAAAGLFSNNEVAVSKLLESAKRTGDKLWRLPLFDEYHDLMKSDNADIANIPPRVSGEASSATAACFLEYFIDYNWVHLDIAGVAYGSSKYSPSSYHGATGRPFYLLMDFLRSYAD